MNIKNFQNNQITLEDIKNISNFVQMCQKTMTVVNPKKGTVIYTAGSQAT